MTHLASRQNPKIKLIRALTKRKGRHKEGLFVVEGIRHVGAAVESGALLEFLLYAPELLSNDYAQSLVATATNTPVYTTTSEIFTSLAAKDNPSGLLAVACQALTPLDRLTPQTFPLGVALVAPQDPGNLGAILRTIDALGASGLILLDGGVDPFHPTAVRASMGALFWKPVVTGAFTDFTAWTQRHQYHLYGSSAKGSHDFTEINYRSPAILLLGSERHGLDADQLALCEAVVRIPMQGKSTSLNLAVAAGILLYNLQTNLNLAEN